MPCESVLKVDQIEKGHHETCLNMLMGQVVQRFRLNLAIDFTMTTEKDDPAMFLCDKAPSSSLRPSATPHRQRRTGPYLAFRSGPGNLLCPFNGCLTGCV